MKKTASDFKQPVTRRFLLVLLLGMLVLLVAVFIISYLALGNTYTNLFSEEAKSLVHTLADQLDGDEMKRYAETGQTDERYASIQALFDSAKSRFINTTYVYAFRPMDSYFIYVVEGHREGDDPADASYLGDTFPYMESAYNHLVPAIKAKDDSDGVTELPDQGYGKTVTAIAFVYGSDGEVACVVEADFLLSEMQQIVMSFAVPVLGVMLAVTALAVVFMIIMMRKHILIPLNDLTEFVRSYEHGKIDESPSSLKYDDELRYMADSFQEMTFRIDKYIHDLTAVTAEKERIGAELNVATQIQADMLPRIFPPFPERKEFDLYATMNPAKEVGGDFYDFFLVDDDHLAMVMADVSGKGVPAALFMVISKTLLKNRTMMGGRPGEILRDVNNQLCEGNDAELFVTVWLGILEISTGHLVSASAGHEYPAFFRAEKGRFDLEKDKHGPPLATMEGLRFRETETDMAHGDAVFLYTDGVTEATSAALELFGEDRMVEALNTCAKGAPSEILPAVRSKIDAFVGTAPQFDDITMLCMRYF